MKSKRLLVFILIGIVVILIAGAGVLYAADSGEVNRQQELTDAISRNQAIFQKGLDEKMAKEAEAVGLAKQLAGAELLMEQTDFLASAESIEYDRILFSIANSTGLQVTSLTATAPSDKKEGDITYQVTIFTVMVEGKTPGEVLLSTEASTSYIDGVVNNILAYINKVATSEDFDTALIQSVNISAPEPMTEDEINDTIENLYAIVEEELTEAETEGKTEDEIALLLKNKLYSKSASEIEILIDEVGLDKPSAVITIQIWTYKGGMD